ncbi:hypothetical protein THRCLA_04341 [Thraustotheca clavata]|uniref:Uncharacterized protein n=1 Tax=Thraustotheca clavata TaxID=74557 RepID=A0A1V9ZZG6_9STRA|nr:hypothetical protein THRCLA_04341 [Thraustotheca clavata]
MNLNVVETTPKRRRLAPEAYASLVNYQNEARIHLNSPKMEPQTFSEDGSEGSDIESLSREKEFGQTLTSEDTLDESETGTVAERLSEFSGENIIAHMTGNIDRVHDKSQEMVSQTAKQTIPFIVTQEFRESLASEITPKVLTTNKHDQDTTGNDMF